MSKEWCDGVIMILCLDRPSKQKQEAAAKKASSNHPALRHCCKQKQSLIGARTVQLTRTEWPSRNHEGAPINCVIDLLASTLDGIALVCRTSRVDGSWGHQWSCFGPTNGPAVSCHCALMTEIHSQSNAFAHQFFLNFWGQNNGLRN